MKPIRLPDDAVLVVGLGYVGKRFMSGLHTIKATGISRRAIAAEYQSIEFDLDAQKPVPLTLPQHYRVLYTVPPSSRARTDVRLQRFLQGLQPAPQCFVYISTTGVYGDRAGDVVDENTDTRPTSARATRRVAAEHSLRVWAGERCARHCILRSPGIYGPGRLGVASIREGEALINEVEANPGNRIHVDDLITCCNTALSQQDAHGIYNVGDGDFRTSTWFVKQVAMQSGLAVPREITRTQAAVTFSARRLSFLADSRRIDTTRMREHLGVTPRYTNAEDGIRASLKEENA